MTVAELRKALESFDDDRLVVLAKDAEGNSYSPLSDLEAGLYQPHTTWSGDVFLFPESAAGDDVVPAVVLGPVN